MRTIMSTAKMRREFFLRIFFSNSFDQGTAQNEQHHDATPIIAVIFWQVFIHSLSASSPSVFFLALIFLIFGCRQLEVFESIGYDAVEHAFVGYNVSVFAYGQTSCGKTFSMMGIPGGADAGLIPRICRTIFHFVEMAADEYEAYEASIEASYLEVYNEKPVSNVHLPFLRLVC